VTDHHRAAEQLLRQLAKCTTMERFSAEALAGMAQAHATLAAARAPVTHELTGTVGLNDRERTFLNYALGLTARQMAANPSAFTDADADAFATLHHLAANPPTEAGGSGG
jgi:hypothetical protein